jgi:hypothetical protein
VHVKAVTTLVVATLISLAIAIPDHAFAAGTAGRIRSSLNVIGPQNGGGEPSVAISPDHTIYVSAPGDAMEFWRSPDGGKTWTQGASPESPSGDTSVNVDQSGAVYESNLNVITGDQNTLQVDLFKSFDRGTTWPQKGSSAIEDSNASGQPALVDRQWVDAWIPPGHTTNTATVCLTYHDFGPSQMWVSCSFDGGRTFGLPVDAITSPLAQADSYCNTIPGGLKIVQSGPHAGRIYIAWLAADPLNPVSGCNLTQLAAFHSIWSAFSDDGGRSWTDRLVYDAGPLHDGSEIFADLTLDNRGNPYVGFVMNVRTEYDIWVEASFDGGSTWNGRSDGTGAPYLVNADQGTHFFAAIAAGSPGQVDVAYLDTRRSSEARRTASRTSRPVMRTPTGTCSWGSRRTCSPARPRSPTSSSHRRPSTTVTSAPWGCSAPPCPGQTATSSTSSTSRWTHPVCSTLHTPTTGTTRTVRW